MSATNAEDGDVSSIAAAIGEPARSKMLYCLLDGRARTSTELSIVGEINASTASVHLKRLRESGLVEVLIQGKHRYYRLHGKEVARALEALSVIAGIRRVNFVSSAPKCLLEARTCYDHIAGRLGVALHNRLLAMQWIKAARGSQTHTYEIASQGEKGLRLLNIASESLLLGRRRVAYPCLDWSERQPHLGGALASALLKVALDRRWVTRDPESRALEATGLGKRELRARLGLEW